MNLNEAKEILNNNGYIIVENKHFDFWQYKLEVKKILNKWLKTQKWYNNFDEIGRASCRERVCHEV